MLRSRAKITYQTFGLLQVELSVTIVTRETSKVNLIFRDSLEHAGERSQRLQAHILETKLLYWNLMATTLKLEPPPTTLLELMHFEIKITTSLNLEQRNIKLEYSGRVMTVGALIRLSARHSVWHAGQIALTRV